MKTMLKKSLLLILALTMMVSLLAACGKKAEPAATEPAAAETAETTEEAKEEEAAYFPRPETETISMWVTWSSNTLDNINEVRAVQEMEKCDHVLSFWSYRRSAGRHSDGYYRSGTEIHASLYGDPERES